jgi:WXXGXW repeat (2 copies)
MEKTKLILVSCLLMAFSAACTVQGRVVARVPGGVMYVRPVAPGPGYIWVGDTWVWSGGRYVYHHGYWVHPRPGRVWVEGSWVHARNGWAWHSGHWGRR